jgi:hypothetical protein
LFLPLSESFPFLLQLPLLFAKARSLHFRFEALLSELFLLALKAVILGLGTGQVTSPVETIALLAALVPWRQHA